MKKKLTSVPLIVARKVNERLLDNTLVLAEVIRRMDVKMLQAEYRKHYGVNEGWHQSHKISGLYDKGCGCMYCQAVHRYTQVKVSAHRLQRRIDNLDFMCKPYENTEPLQHLKLLNAEWPQLRAVKEEIRQQIGL